jgi:hypothetical protein
LKGDLHHVLQDLQPGATPGPDSRVNTTHTNGRS